MSRATPQMRKFAGRLIDREMKGLRGAANNPGAFPVGEKLRVALVGLMGMGGFRALLSRSLALARAEAPWLQALQVRADGTLEVAGKVKASVQEIAEGRVVLFAHLLGLLVAFIGEILTLRLVRETWPNLPLDDIHFN